LLPITCVLKSNNYRKKRPKAVVVSDVFAPRKKERDRERRNERKKARRVRVNEKLPIFAALRKERDPIFVFESGREKERERRRGENERLDDISPSPLNLARVRVYLAAGETAHGDDHVCSESNLYFPVVVVLVFFCAEKCLVVFY